MQRQRLRRLIGAHLAWWCLFGIALTVLQPFIAVHFRQDGWEDEPAFRIRAVSATAQFEPDARGGDHPETSLFVSAGASIDLPNAMQHGLDGLMALVGALVALTVALPPLVTQATARHRLRQRVGPLSRAPPPTFVWRRCPPETAPPLAT